MAHCLSLFSRFNSCSFLPMCACYTANERALQFFLASQNPTPAYFTTCCVSLNFDRGCRLSAMRLYQTSAVKTSCHKEGPPLSVAKHTCLSFAVRSKAHLPFLAALVQLAVPYSHMVAGGVD